MLEVYSLLPYQTLLSSLAFDLLSVWVNISALSTVKGNQKDGKYIIFQMYCTGAFILRSGLCFFFYKRTVCLLVLLLVLVEDLRSSHGNTCDGKVEHL